MRASRAWSREVFSRYRRVGRLPPRDHVLEPCLRGVEVLRHAPHRGLNAVLLALRKLQEQNEALAEENRRLRMANASAPKTDAPAEISRADVSMSC